MPLGRGRSRLRRPASWALAGTAATPPIRAKSRGLGVAVFGMSGSRHETGGLCVRADSAPDDWKPMKTVGPGVREIRVKDDGGAYRVIYLATLADAAHVYHVFQKKTEKTSKKDLDTAKARYKEHIRSVKK
jgi:putative component of toxin-antitoxin plasmid stabilization module